MGSGGKLDVDFAPTWGLVRFSRISVLEGRLVTEILRLGLAHSFLFACPDILGNAAPHGLSLSSIRVPGYSRLARCTACAISHRQ